MSKEELGLILKEEVATVTFQKNDGSIRVLKCTLDPSYLPKQNTTPESIKTERKPNPDILSVWDIENSGWRSFKMSSIKSIDI